MRKRVIHFAQNWPRGDDKARYLKVQDDPTWTLTKNNVWIKGQITKKQGFLSIGQDPGKAASGDDKPDYYGAEMAILNAAVKTGAYTTKYIGNYKINGVITPVYEYDPSAS